MALLAEYIKALEEQKKLIRELGDSGPSLPGLNVEEIAKRLAELDENLSKTVDYYNAKADADAKKEEDEAAQSGVEETEEQKQERRRKKREEAQKKIKETTDKFIETQRDFIQEQISIIKVNWGVIKEESADIPKTITLASTTSLQPAALGAAAPNPIFNLGLLYQVLKSIARSVNNIKTAFLNMLIAADKIKFALPPEVTKTLNTILAIQKSLGGSIPKTSDVDQPPPNTPEGTEIQLKTNEFRNLTGPGGNIVVTADNLVQARKGQTGQVVEYIRENGVVVAARIKIGPVNQSSQSEGNSGSSSSFEPS